MTVAMIIAYLKWCLMIFIDENNDDNCFHQYIDQNVIEKALANGISYVKGDTSLSGHVDETIVAYEVNEEEVVTNVPPIEKIGELENDYESEDLDSVQLNSNRDVEEE